MAGAVPFQDLAEGAAGQIGPVAIAAEMAQVNMTQLG